MDKFADYMWYLLHAPFKKISKTVNQWYILLKVLGKRFDRAKDAVLQARDESMIATCGEHMLMQIGRERGLGRYENEDIENYRRRIALYPEVCRLGGTNEGIILAVKSLGYTGVDYRTGKSYGKQYRALGRVLCSDYDGQRTTSDRLYYFN